MKNFSKLISIIALLTWVLIVLGAAVRVADAGLSCPDWPLCYGQWVPFPAPEGGFTAEGVRYSTLQVSLEWGHRLLASIVGFLMLAAGILAWNIRKEKPAVWWATLATLALLASQVKLGGITVWLDNVNWSVALHLGNALLFFGGLIILRRLATQPTGATPVPCGGWTRLLIWVMPFAIFITMLMGAMVSTSHAGGACGGLFSCFGDWLPKEDMHQLLHMKHRYLALLTTGMILLFFVLTRRADKALRASGHGMMILLVGQVLLGIATLYSFSHFAQWYQALSVAHLGWGTLLWMASIGVVCKLYLGAGGSFHASK